MMTLLSPKGHFSGDIETGIPGVHWDNGMTMVNLTSMLGALVAVFATLLPMPLLNIARVEDDAISIVRSSRTIWAASIQYLCGDKVQPFRKRTSVGKR